MAEIISDGTRSVTSDDTSARDYSGHGYGYGNMPFHVSEWANERVRDVLGAVERNGRSAELATEKVGAATQIGLEKTAASNQLANSLAFANTQNLLISGFKDGRFDASNYAAAISKQLAECCCEIKELVRAEGGQTRDLINGLNALEKAVEVADLKNQLAAALIAKKV